MLILGAADDRGFSAVEREALIACYPGATVRIFAGGGHWVALAQRAAYEATLDGFLLGERAEERGRGSGVIA